MRRGAVPIALLQGIPAVDTHVSGVDRIIAVCKECGLDQNGSLFEKVMSDVRAALFHS